MDLGKQIAMHIAATNPLATCREKVNHTVIEHERSVLTAEAKESNRSENIIEKIVEGRIRKFYEEVVLLSQAFVLSPDITVEEAVKKAEVTVGAPIMIVDFIRFQLGEGIKKVETDFATEVSAIARS
jgi:elongation factor Ts